jgi:hypothetical protein
MLVERARDLLIGDRVFLMLAIRRVTLGDDFPFDHECPKCEKTALHIVDLSKLEVKNMPEPKKRVHEGVTPSGKKVRWHCMSGKEEETLSKVGTSDALSASILVRLDLLNDAPAGMAALKAMSMKDREWLRGRFEDTEGGVDTTIKLVCEHCGHEFEDQLDVGQTGFFFPSRLLKRSSKSIFSS